MKRDRAVFLDRDGTIIKDTGYPSRIGDMVLLRGAAAAIGDLNRRHWQVVVISNQSGVGRGMFDSSEVDEFNEELRKRLSKQGAQLDAFYYCPHEPGPDGEPACSCRKPEPGLLLQAAAELDVRLDKSVMVGDKDSDITAGARAGCRTVLLAPDAAAPAPGTEPDHVAPDLAAAVQWINGNQREGRMAERPGRS